MSNVARLDDYRESLDFPEYNVDENDNLVSARIYRLQHFKYSPNVTPVYYEVNSNMTALSGYKEFKQLKEVHYAIKG